MFLIKPEERIHFCLQEKLELIQLSKGGMAQALRASFNKNRYGFIVYVVFNFFLFVYLGNLRTRHIVI